VYFKGTVFPHQRSCPSEATAATRIGDLIVCSSCLNSFECTDPLRPACVTHCVPGACELDSSGCCPVQECSLD
jgi:hypothetical protein